jgi:alanine racemase
MQMESRSWGNGVDMLSKNNKAQIVGSVCMDMLMIDVLGINCHEGDVVVVFGKTLQ